MVANPLPMLDVLAAIGVIVAVLLLIAGVFATLLGLPGSVVVLVVSTVLSAFTHWQRPPWWMLLVLLVLTAAAELADNWLSAVGARRYGGGPKAGWWAMGGGIVGALVGGWIAPVTGILGPAVALMAFVVLPLGLAMAGAYGAGYWYERRQGRSHDEAKRAGWGAFLGRAAGSLLKFVLAASMAAATLWLFFRGGGPS